MPLRDHFRPPLDNRFSWEGFHGGWPMVIVQQLCKRLPEGYIAEPRVHLGAQVEVDIAAFDQGDSPYSAFGDEEGGVATAVWAPPVAMPDLDEYEVRIYDAQRQRQLVAVIEIVSPANKDRPEHRNLFVAKCAALLQKEVAVSIVDIATTRRFNLYAELLAFLGQRDPKLGDDPTPIYAASCRWTSSKKRARLEAWSHILTLGQPLPTLPLWLNADRVVPLDLEQSYEQACSDLRIQ